jgi:hypothetical protein
VGPADGRDEGTSEAPLVADAVGLADGEDDGLLDGHDDGYWPASSVTISSFTSSNGNVPTLSSSSSSVVAYRVGTALMDIVGSAVVGSGDGSKVGSSDVGVGVGVVGDAVCFDSHSSSPTLDSVLARIRSLVTCHSSTLLSLSC